MRTKLLVKVGVIINVGSILKKTIRDDKSGAARAQSAIRRSMPPRGDGKWSVSHDLSIITACTHLHTLDIK